MMLVSSAHEGRALAALADAIYDPLMLASLVKVLRWCASAVRRIIGDDGSGGRVDRAHGENFGKAPHGSGLM